MSDTAKEIRLALTIALVLMVILKLADVISWSWWWVMSPVWVPLLACVPFGIYVALVRAMDNARDDSMQASDIGGHDAVKREKSE